MLKIRLLLDSSRRLRQDESGQSLMIAIVFLTIFGILLAVVLGFVDTSFRAVIAFRAQSSIISGSDGAIDAATNFYRQHESMGRVGEDCPTFGPVDYTDRNDDSLAVTVECDAMAVSGSPEDPGFEETVPDQAILTLSTSTAIQGIQQTANETIRVRGDVYSNTNVALTGGNKSVLEVVGSVTGVTGCSAPAGVALTDAIQVSNELNCGPDSLSPREDPDYPMLVDTPPPGATPPPCAGTLVTFEPGTYRSVAALNALTGTGGCSGRVFWFKPGVYYFDFADGDLWRMNQGTDGAFTDYVAGTPEGWSSTTTVGPGNLPPLIAPDTPDGRGRSCKTEKNFADDPPGSVPSELERGVVWYFGGTSQVLIDTPGEVEICAEPSLEGDTERHQNIAIYGIKETTGAPPETVEDEFDPVTATSTDFLPPAAGRVIDDGSVAVANLASGATGSMVLEGFCSDCIPDGATVTDAQLEIRHRDRPGISSVAATAAYNSTSTPCPVTRANNTHTDPCPLGPLSEGELESLVLTYTATAGSGMNRTDEIDGALIRVTYEVPGTGFREQSGDLVDPGSDDTHFFEASGSPVLGLSVHGTLYAPLSGARLFLNNESGQAIDRGLVTRYLKLHTPASLEFDGFPISLPEGERGNRLVLLLAVVDGRDRVRALVEFDDDCEELPCDVGKAVIIRRWTYVGA